MTIILGQEKPSLDELFHSGVKGMKWGHHKAQPSGSTTAGPSNRQLNKASRQADKAKRKTDSAEFNKKVDSDIDAARARLAGHGQQLKEAKTQFKQDKQKVGSREARKKLNEVRTQVAVDREIAQWAKSGKETRNAVLLAVGTVAVGSILKAGLASAAR
jgi:hypothetical protein